MQNLIGELATGMLTTLQENDLNPDSFAGHAYQMELTFEDPQQAERAIALLQEWYGVRTIRHRVVVEIEEPVLNCP